MSVYGLLIEMSIRFALNGRVGGDRKWARGDCLTLAEEDPDMAVSNIRNYRFYTLNGH
jgi:hypothetical protein